MERMPIEVGTELEMDGVTVRIEECTGDDLTGFVYNGRIVSQEMESNADLVTVREFYPKSKKSEFDVERDEDGILHISCDTQEMQEFQNRLRQFETVYQIQKKLANSETMNIIANLPLYKEKFGDSSYVVSRIRRGKSLDKAEFVGLNEKLACAIRTVELFGILHKAGYMMLDFKPENLLWIDDLRMVKLIDAESVISIWNHEDDTDYRNAESEQEAFYSNSRYSAPQILELKEIMRREGEEAFAEKRSEYLKPLVNVYSLGIFLFELLFERQMTEEDKQFSHMLQRELFVRYKDALVSEQPAQDLLTVIKTALQKSDEEFMDADGMMRALNALIEKITFRKYETKREISEANYTYLSYNMLEQYPLYEFSRTVDGIRILDVAIIGSHPFRKHLIKTIISCGQMLNARLNIRLVAEDAEQFFEDYSSGQNNPELRKTVELFIEGEIAQSREAVLASELVEEPLATVYLYRDDSMDSIQKIIRENGTAYVILAGSKEEGSYEYVKALLKGLPRKKQFVGYVTGEQHPQEKVKDRIVLYPIVTESISDGYDEHAYKSRIYDMGMVIHEFYYRGNNSRATEKQVREAYAKDLYNVESSERSALHANYKLKSIGIDPKSPQAPYQFYDRVLSQKGGTQKELFDALVALEHRSWTAFMILSGVRAVDDMQDDFMRYAYQEANDWKMKDRNGRVVAHPCLKAGSAGRKLNMALWARRTTTKESQLIKSGLDPLDRRSMAIYNAVYDISESRKGQINKRLEELQEVLRQNPLEVIDAAYQALVNAKEKVYGRETNSEHLWEEANRELQSIFEKEGIQRGNEKLILEDIGRMMQPVLWVVRYHDFKASDEDIIRALPKLILQSQSREQSKAQITVIKPMAKNAWQNLYSSIVINPDRLVLVPGNGESVQVVDQYISWLRSCHVDTEVQIRSLKQLREYGGKDGCILVDETGVEAEYVRRILGNPYMKRAHVFRVDGRSLKSTDDTTFVELFDRPVNLTVNETLMLHGAEMISENLPDYIVGMPISEYKSMWNLYRDLRDGRKWKIFINELNELESNKTKKIPLDNKTTYKTYECSYVENTALRCSGLDNVFEILKKANVITGYTIPVKDRYGLVQIVTLYPDIAEELQRMVQQAGTAPFSHQYKVMLEENKVLFTDQSLYITGTVPHEILPEIKGDAPIYRDDVMKEVCNILNRSNRDKVLQNFKVNDASPSTVSFRFASESVREILRKEGSLLEALIYLECRNRGIFDDIRINVEFMWAGKRTKNEVDIVGTKNSKTYFISAKMAKPERKYVHEIHDLCAQFGIEGEAILISSHYSTGKNERTGNDYSDRPNVLENRMEDMERMSYVGKDGVDIVVENGSGNGNRRIVVATSIEEIVKKSNR